MSLIIDGVTYNVGIVQVTRKPVVDRTLIGVTLDGVKHYITKGTYYNYEITITTRTMDISAYDSLYEVLTSPSTVHSITVPYNQTSLTFDATLKAGNDSIIQNFINFKRWGSLKIEAEAIEYAREAIE